MGIILGSNRKFAFYSPENHVRDDGVLTFACKDADGKSVLANYAGSMIDGFPGLIREGVVVRPYMHETYVVLGEIGGPTRGKLMAYKSVNRRTSATP